MRQDQQIVGEVADFFQDLFGAIFTAPFEEDLKNDRYRRGAVTRRVGDVADASSQAITRFFHNEQLGIDQVRYILAGWSSLRDRIALADIANVNVTPESLAGRLALDCPPEVTSARQEAVFRLALHSVLQVLMLVGPVMNEWRRLNFAPTFALVQQVVQRLDQIGAQLAVGRSGQETVDERYELSYRDHLLLRFNRVEAGTVRMTTNMAVDLRELFVMPRVRTRPKREEGEGADGGGLMRLAEARRAFDVARKGKPASNPDGHPALDDVRGRERMVLVGVPGSGKSSFLEWLQLRLAGGEEELVLGGQQAIPLLLRVRQLDPTALPVGSALIEKATASKELATVMPADWIGRQMEKGRVLVMVDGLDETDPELRTGQLLPWLTQLCCRYPRCRYLISSRPVGYPAGTLDDLGFAEYELLDFDDQAVKQYAQHWCTSVRLAQNEPDAEARAAGQQDGVRIVAGFDGHPYIRNLARTPLMLSAICLVHYFEGGELPKDRAVLYRLCVEGLLHYWDQRRGIRAEFGLEDKLRVCREVAIAMQALDQAEIGLPEVVALAGQVLGDPRRAERLIEHVRYRTGLLIERRPCVFAFAHLTFQEYLAAVAVNDGNRTDIDEDTLVRDHGDGRWNEVIALYCGIAASGRGRRLLQRIMAGPDAPAMADVLGNAMQSSGLELAGDDLFRKEVIRHIAMLDLAGNGSKVLSWFDKDEVAPIANDVTGSILGRSTAASAWLTGHHAKIDAGLLLGRLRESNSTDPHALGDLVCVTHVAALRELSHEIERLVRVYAMPGPMYTYGGYATQGLLAMAAFANSEASERDDARVLNAVVLQLFVATANLDRDALRDWPILRAPVGILDAWEKNWSAGERVEVGRLAARLATKCPRPDVAAELAERSARLLSTAAPEPGPTPKPRKKRPPR